MGTAEVLIDQPAIERSPPLFPDQQKTIALGERSPIIFDMSDPGTGKTRAHLEIWARRRQMGGKCALVLAPKSILQVAWGADIDRFLPGVRYSIAYAHNRRKAFDINADIYITNHDAVTWLVKNFKREDWEKFDTLIVDESTAFKHRTSARSKALRAIAPHFQYRAVLTGTPFQNTITEIWHQAFVLDQGERLGKSFWKFQSAVCEPQPIPGAPPGAVKWTDKPGAEQAVYDLLTDIMIRNELAGLPENQEYTIRFDIPDSLRKHYDDMLDAALIELGDEIITATHAGAINQKALQIIAGAIYAGDGTYRVLDDTRTELIMDLLDARAHTLVFFNWHHQRDQLVEQIRKRKWTYGVIDGSVTGAARKQVVDDCQAGRLKVVLAHPASAAHGLTLTRCKTTIFASPTYNLEHYKQAKHRIHRRGQDEKTETIHVLARDTVDEPVYRALQSKQTATQLFLELVSERSKRQ